MMPTLKKLANELPSILVALWAVLRVFGIEVDQEIQSAVFEAASAGIGLGIWLLVRRNTDGPVTVYEKKKADES